MPAVSAFAERVTARFVNPYDPRSMSGQIRGRRWEMLTGRFPELADMHVLDIGGMSAFWRTAPVRPAHVTLVNLAAEAVPEPWITSLAGDACALPDGLPETDMAFSNSVIEHVGGHFRQQQFAAQLRAAAPRYWMQTPYRYFPMEPHFLAPGLQFLPIAARVRYAQAWPFGNYAPIPQRDRALRATLQIDLLSVTQVTHLFPDAEVLRERIGPLVKSLVAVRASPA
jgi:hypothetical protein